MSVGLSIAGLAGDRKPDLRRWPVTAQVGLIRLLFGLEYPLQHAERGGDLAERPPQPMPVLGYSA
jgi:hypothetical protein